MTVEATVVFTVMIYAFVLMVYICVFTYDKILVSQDAYSMTIYAKEEYLADSSNMLDEMDKKFSQLKEDRPYMVLQEYEMSVSKNKLDVIVNACAVALTPFIDYGFGQSDKKSDINVKKSTKVINPADIMLLIRDIKEGIENDFIQYQE